MIFASPNPPCSLVQSAWSCKLKSLAAWLWEPTHPSSSSFDGSLPNAATFWGRHPSGPVLWIQNLRAPWSYNFWKEKWQLNERRRSISYLYLETVKIWSLIHLEPSLEFWQNYRNRSQNLVLRLGIKCARKIILTDIKHVQSSTEEIFWRDIFSKFVACNKRGIFIFPMLFMWSTAT